MLVQVSSGLSEDSSFPKIDRGYPLADPGCFVWRIRDLRGSFTAAAETDPFPGIFGILGQSEALKLVEIDGSIQPKQQEMPQLPLDARDGPAYHSCRSGGKKAANLDPCSNNHQGRSEAR